ncbi:MAG: dihydropteroate synthase-like protein [Desulfurococcaceae archaeon]|nr:dihydropteroate synthase-like protein [Desulfurococcaceae archaeon]
MRVLLVTGQLAKHLVEEYAKKAQERVPGVEIRVLALPVKVAAMLNSEYLARVLPEYKDALRGVDIVVVPGFTRGDLTELERLLGVPVVKGTYYAHDIPLLVELLASGVGLSPSKPADEVLESEKSRVEERALREAWERARRDFYFKIRDTPVSRHYPLILLELYAESESGVELGEPVKYTDVVLVGFPLEFSRSSALRVIKSIRDSVDKPVGVDTLDFELIREARELVDIVNGIPCEDFERVLEMSYLKEKPLVITCSRGSAVERVEFLEKVVEKLESSGFERVIVDPVLNPPLSGLAESLEAYITLRRALPRTPILMGVGNVIELADVDSIGLNALLAFIGVELGVELYLVTEASVKTRGATRELRRALEMAIIARELRKPPKDMTRSLLVAKSKRRASQTLPRAGVVVRAVERAPLQLDPKGYFRVSVDHEHGEIVLQHYIYGRDEPTLEVRGGDPYAILAEIERRGLASRSQHYFYLGSELTKAYIALKLGKEYEQDKDLF